MEGSEHRSPELVRAESAVDLVVAEDAAPGLALMRVSGESMSPPSVLARPRSSTLGPLRWIAVAAILVISSFSLHAQTIKEVRVGAHPDFVRVVFESDAALKVTTAVPRPGVIEAEFPGAVASSPVLSDPRKQLKSFSLRPEGSSLIVTLGLGIEQFSVRRYRITRPHRIVLDISPEVPAAEQALIPLVDVAPMVDAGPLMGGVLGASGGVRSDFAWIAGAIMLVMALSGALWIYQRSKPSAPVVVPAPDSDSRRKITDLDRRIQQQIAAYQRLVERREEL